ncbi:M20 family metallo-hydrolase [Helcococcus bovis]|uniref:M20 family metallo-hydrolase n=1 Tax=Helcococcus bovis TaxID=3153252 RepID=UPI0038BABCAC
MKISTKRIEKDLEELKKFTATHGNGATRLPFTKETREAAEYLKELLRDAELEVREDTVGNVYGTRRGKDSSLPAIVMGSHYDSVQNGGNYDGIAGVVTAIEIARLLRDNKVQLERDFVVIAFMDEEGMRFGTGYFGSKGILGELSVEETKKVADKDGISIYQAMKDYGLEPERIPQAAWPKGRIGNFIELHIEQGPVLNTNKLDLGLVTGIVGLKRFMVTVNGRADHAGTTPMDMRKDSVEMATKVISKIPDYAREIGKSTVATVGFIETLPGGVNVVANSVKFSIDVRSLEIENVNEVVKRVKNDLDEVTKLYDADYTMIETLEILPAKLSDKMIDIMEESVKKHGHSYVKLPSGAGHDSLPIAHNIKDTVMIFVPSENGRSHSPDEYTPYSYFGKATDVLYDLTLAL